MHKRLIAPLCSAVIALLCVLPAAAQVPTLSYVQGCVHSAAGLSDTCVMALNVTAGNLLIVASKSETIATGSLAVSTASGVSLSFTQVTPPTSFSAGSIPFTAAIYAAIIPSTGAETVQITWTGTGGGVGGPFSDTAVGEYNTTGTWLSPVLDRQTATPNSSSSGATCPTGTFSTTTNPNDLVIAVAENWNAGQTWGALAGWVNEAASSRNTVGWYDQQLSGLSADSAAIPFTSNDFCTGMIAAFKSSGSPWAGILSPPRAMDWSQAGASHIWDTRTQCSSAACQVMCSDFPTCAVAKNNTAANINAALAAAPYNTYVQLPPTSGSDSIAGIKFPAGGSGLTTCTTNCSNITLRGAGPQNTVFTLTGQTCVDSGTSAICAESSDLNYMGGPTNTANWTAGYTQNGTTITLSAVTNLKVGWPIVLDQLDDSSDTGALWVDCESSVVCGIDGPSSFQRTGRGQFQIVNVASCTTGGGAGDTTFGHTCTSGTGVTITPGLYAPNWRTGQTPGAWWATSPIFNDGVENLSATYNNGVGVVFFNCTGCWLRNFKGVRTSSTPTGWFHGSAFISNHITFRDSYFYGFPGDSYVVGPQMASDLLIENNISNKPAGYVYNSDCEGCVLAYNFSIDAGANAAAFLSQSHWWHSITLYTLDEGNFGAGAYLDPFHGTHNMQTMFRNRWQGKGIDGSGNPTTGGNNALIIAFGSRYNNFIGNVMGMPGYHNGYLSGSQAVADIDTSDTHILSSTLLWGNYSVGPNANLFCTGSGVPIASCPADERAGSATTYPGLASPSTTFPSSFFYSTTPSWWPSGKAWPIIGPDITSGNVGVCPSGTFAFSDVITTVSNVCGVGITPSALASGQVSSSPAMDCYFLQMGGNANGTNGPLAFDPTVCPGFNGPQAQTSSPPAPAIGLFARGQTKVSGSLTLR